MLSQHPSRLKEPLRVRLGSGCRPYLPRARASGWSVIWVPRRQTQAKELPESLHRVDREICTNTCSSNQSTGSKATLRQVWGKSPGTNRSLRFHRMLIFHTPSERGQPGDAPSGLGGCRTINTGPFGESPEGCLHCRVQNSALDITTDLKTLGLTGPYRCCCSPVRGPCRVNQDQDIVDANCTTDQLDSGTVALVSPRHITSKNESCN